MAVWIVTRGVRAIGELKDRRRCRPLASRRKPVQLCLNRFWLLPNTLQFPIINRKADARHILGLRNRKQTRLTVRHGFRVFRRVTTIKRRLYLEFASVQGLAVPPTSSGDLARRLGL